MIRFFILALFFCLSPVQGNARAVKLGAMNQPQTNLGSPSGATLKESVSCLETKDCPYDKECVTLQCESVCKKDSCSDG